MKNLIKFSLLIIITTLTFFSLKTIVMAQVTNSSTETKSIVIKLKDYHRVNKFDLSPDQDMDVILKKLAQESHIEDAVPH